MSKNETVIYFDMDRAVEVFNEKFPDNEITKADIAREVGITYNTMGNWQNGKLPNAFLVVEKICNYTGISKDELIKKRK